MELTKNVRNVGELKIYSYICGMKIKNIENKIERPRIIDVVRKPRKCPVCGERVVDIIYGTGDMTQIEFFLAYRQEGIVGGDIIPRRPPIWECTCGCVIWCTLPQNVVRRMPCA